MADLTVTTANPGTISGVISNPSTPTITGVTSANSGGNISVVQSPTYSGTLQGTYNPQGTAISPTGPTVNPQPGAINPQTGAVDPNAPAAGQLFYLGDGSAYDVNGNQVVAPRSTTSNTQPVAYGAAQPGQYPTTLNTPTPDVTTNTNSLTNDTGYSDILKLLNTNLSNMDKLFSNLSQYSTVGADEQAQQAKVAKDQAGMAALGYQAEGLYNPNNEKVDLPFLTGEAQSKMVTGGIQAQLDQSVLNYMQGNRQFAFNSAATMFDASQKSLQTMLDVYTKAAPQNIGTNYNPTTGQLTAIMRNPLTGATYTGNLGNIGAQKSFTSTNIATNPLTGELTFVGTTADGRVVTQPIGSNFSTGGTQNPLQPGSVSVPGYGGAVNPQTGQPWRTDANNNPIAAAIATNSSGNEYTKALDAAGIPWEKGSTFSNGTMSTIKILGNPIEGARAILSGSSAIQNWYINHTGSGILGKYGITNNAQFSQASTATQNSIIDGIYRAEVGSGILTNPTYGQNSSAQLPYALQGAVKTLADGTRYFDTNQLTSAQLPMAQAYASQTGIHYVNPTDASKLGDINVTQQNLSEFKSFADNVLGNVPGVLNSLYYGVGSIFGSTTATQFDSYRNIAINAIQSLAGGTGSGLRITAGEIATAVSNLPTIGDSKAQADTKLTVLDGLLNKWTSQILPGWMPSGGGIDYTQTLNQLLQATP